MDRTMEEIMEGLVPILDDLDAIAREAVTKYRRYPAEILIEHSPRAAANCIYSHMEVAADRLNLREGVVALEIRGLKVWLHGEAAVIRFKKMDEDGRSRNYPTKQARDYDRNVPLPGLPPPAARLVVGYLLDPTGTSVVRVQVARPVGRTIDWCAAIVPASDRREGKRAWIDVTRQGRL